MFKGYSSAQGANVNYTTVDKKYNTLEKLQMNNYSRILSDKKLQAEKKWTKYQNSNANIGSSPEPMTPSPFVK